ncbi:MAG: hypothetical protein AABZ53_04635 [Planctomycetota bacterium]
MNSAALVMAAGSLVLSVFAIQLVRTSQERAASEVWEALRPMYSDAGLHMPDKTPETVAEMLAPMKPIMLKAGYEHHWGGTGDSKLGDSVLGSFVDVDF